MVVTQSQHFSGQIFCATTHRVHNHHGCFSERLGRSHEWSDSSGQMESRAEYTAYKLFRDVSSNVISETLPSQSERESCFDSLRQSISSSVLEQTGRHQVIAAVQPHLGSMEFSNKKQHLVKSCSYSRQEKLFGGQSESESFGSNRVVPQFFSCSENFSELGESSHGFVCQSGELKNNSVLQLDKQPESICERCSLNFMGEHVCICVSSNSIDPKYIRLHATLSLPNYSDSTTLASQVLVHKAFNSQTNSSSSPERSAISKTNITPRSRESEINCMAVIDKRFRTKGFSSKTRKLLSESWRSGTKRDYSAKFRRFSSWCSEREIDLYSISLTDIADFLADLFHAGLQYKTITGYRSMLSSVLLPVDNKPVGQHPTIIRLLKGVFNLRPPRSKVIPEWELPVVLNALEQSPFEPMMEAKLKFITLKTVFLIAVTTFRRCGDLQSLTLGEENVRVQNRGITFVRKGLSKQDRLNHISPNIFVPAFKETKLLDPKRALAIYLKKKLRNIENRLMGTS